VLAEGLAAESYLDTGNRCAFGDGEERCESPSAFTGMTG
jgi:hypothetical protein